MSYTPEEQEALDKYQPLVDEIKAFKTDVYSKEIPSPSEIMLARYIDHAFNLVIEYRNQAIANAKGEYAYKGPVDLIRDYAIEYSIAYASLKQLAFGDHTANIRKTIIS